MATYTNSKLATYTNLTNNKSNGRKYELTRITPHVVVGQWTAKKIADYFANTQRECSCNYGIGKDGEISLSVEEKNRAWTTSSSDNDNRAITFEIASDTTDPYAITDKAYNAMIDLMVDICKRYGKKRLLWLGSKEATLAYTVKSDELVLTAHRWFAAKACPGDFLYSQYAKIAETVTNRLTTSTTSTVTTKTLTKEQKWAVDNGLFAGYGNGEYGWDDPLTRGQAAILFYRYFEKLDKVG